YGHHYLARPTGPGGPVTRCGTSVPRVKLFICGRSVPCGFFFCDNPFQTRYVLEQPLSGQHNKVIAELRVLEINFEQLFISYGHHLPIFNAFDGRGSPLIWSKETKLAHETSRRNLDADFPHQKLSRDRQEHFGSYIILLA